MDSTAWTTADWKKLFVEWEDEQYHKGNLDMIDKLYSPDLVDHHLPAEYPTGNDGERRLVRELLDAFPDFHITMDDLVVERTDNGEMVVERFTITGTHRGTYRGIPATERPFETHGIWTSTSTTTYLCRRGASPGWKTGCSSIAPVCSNSSKTR